MNSDGRVDEAGIELNVNRMALPRNLQERYGLLMDRAVRRIAEIEGGAYANADENRQVGHNWLRDFDLAPAEYRPELTSCHERIEGVCKEFSARGLEAILWIGIGGSAMAPQLLVDALAEVGSPPMFFFDNTDPSGFQRTLAQLDATASLDKTLVVVVSKSGGTKETRTGMCVVQQVFSERKLSFETNAVAITGDRSALDELAVASQWMARLPLWDWVGGRTSMFSAVGMLPAQLCGLGPAQLMAGAKEMDEKTRGRDLDRNPALLLATAWLHAVETRRLRNMVTLPYCDRLVLLSKYLQQLIMESLGKDGEGISVFGNKGSTDQHSFVQQLREGYADFFVTFISVRKPTGDWTVDPARDADPEEWTKARTAVDAGDYLAAYLEGTAAALQEAGRPSLKLTIDELTPKTLGALIALFERAVGFYAEMIGINAYHQPGVEAGKKAAENVLDDQSALVHCLQQAEGPMSIDELSCRTGVDRDLAYDTLYRLHVCDRFGVRLDDDTAQQPIRRRTFLIEP